MGSPVERRGAERLAGESEHVRAQGRASCAAACKARAPQGIPGARCTRGAEVGWVSLGYFSLTIQREVTRPKGRNALAVALEATSHRPQATGDGRRATGDRRQATGDRRQATGEEREAGGTGPSCRPVRRPFPAPAPGRTPATARWQTRRVRSAAARSQTPGASRFSCEQ